MAESAAPPTDIAVAADRKSLALTFADGLTATVTAELLRVESPSAEVQGHGPDQKTLVPGKRHVAFVALEPVGNYAVRIAFDDGHSTGIYTWAYLRELAERGGDLWAAYEAALAAKGWSREPRW